MNGLEADDLFQLMDDRICPGHAKLKKISEKMFAVGDVVAMPNGEIPAERNEPDEVTLSLHIYDKIA